MFYIILTLDLTIFCCLSQLPRHCDTNHGTGITIYGQNIQRKNGEKEEKARIPKKLVLRKPYITPGFGPLALKYGSIVMGKSLKTGLVAYIMRKIKEIIIHCSATREGRDYTVADIDRWHRERGFFCIGYHFVIYRDGSIHVESKF